MDNIDWLKTILTAAALGIFKILYDIYYPKYPRQFINGVLIFFFVVLLPFAYLAFNDYAKFGQHAALVAGVVISAMASVLLVSVIIRTRKE